MSADFKNHDIVDDISRPGVRYERRPATPAEARQIVDDAVELAGIELRRRNVSIHTYVAQRLPLLRVDPILIEQVLLNLLKNSAEAIDNAGLPSARRHIELRVVPGPEERGHRALVRSLLLDQVRWPGHRPQPLPHDRREPPGPNACTEPLQWRGRCRLSFLVHLAGGVA